MRVQEGEGGMTRRKQYGRAERIVDETIESIGNAISNEQSRSTKAGLAVKKARGERTGGIPYGMRAAADGMHLVSDAGEQAVIDAAVRMVTSGMSLSRCSSALAERGMLNRAGKPLSKCALHFMVKRASE